MNSYRYTQGRYSPPVRVVPVCVVREAERTRREKVLIVARAVVYAGLALAVVAYTYAQFAAALFPGGKP
jgi:hypothetical protein